MVFVGMAVQVSSPAFEMGGAIPRKYTGEGEDVSPPLEWTGLPAETREVALICDDPDAPMPEPFVHWVVYKISANGAGFPEGTTEGALYALDAQLDATPGLTKDQLLAAMEGHVLDEGELVGTYEL